MQLLTIFLATLLLLAACATPAQPSIHATESQQMVINGTFETSLLVTEWRGHSEGIVLFPIDPRSGDPLPDYTPIPLGQTSLQAFSPDMRTLAVVTYPDQNTYNGSLMLIDLMAWKEKRFELNLSGWVSRMVFSPDGQRLAIAHGESNYKLTVVQVERGDITAQSPIGSFITHLKFTENGGALMLYRPTIDPHNQWKAGSPRVELLDAADLSPLWSVALEEVQDGIFPRNENVTASDFYEPGQSFYLSPGLAFAPDRDALYIVHANSEQLTTVDFKSQKVKTVAIQTQLNWFERLLSLTAGAAHAKVGDGITRQVAVSPDGRFLYVVGINRATFVDQQANWQMEQTPLGLEILQTRDGSRIDHIETDTHEISLSPDGRFLYMRNWGNEQDYIPWTEVLDTSSFKILSRQDKTSANPVLLMNGHYLLASSYSTSETSHHMSILQPDGSSVLTAWTDTNYVSWPTIP